MIWIFSKISIFITLQLYLAVYCLLLILPKVETLQEMYKEDISNSPSLAASIARFCKLHPKKLSGLQGLKVLLTGKVNLREELTKHRDLL